MSKFIKIVIQEIMQNERANISDFVYLNRGGFSRVFCIIDKVIKIETKIGSKTIKCLRMSNYHFIKIVNEKILEK